MSEPKEPKNVRSYRREHLEPEIAAMSVEIDEDEPPALIVNIDDPEAKSGVRKVIVLIGAGLWGLTEWVRRAVQAHPVTVLAGTAVATTAAAAVLSVVVADDKRQPPPVAIERVITLPASPRPVQTVTAIATRTVTASRTPGPSVVAALAKSSPSQAHPPPTVAPASEPTVAPTPRRTPRATRPATTTPPTQIPSPLSSRSSDAPPTVANETPKPEPEPEPEPPPTDDPPRPTMAAAGCGGLVEVDLDPLLEVCLLG